MDYARSGVLIVSFVQARCASGSYGDHWRVSPPCMRAFFGECGLEVVYEEGQVDRVHVACWRLFVGSRRAERWGEQMPEHRKTRVA
jgi:hypothetical protein